jgi:hypothetical protein
MTPADAAKAADLPNPNGLYNFFAGRSSSLSAETYRKLARVIPGATVASLQGLERSSVAMDSVVLVKAEARAGHLRPSFELALHDQTETPVPVTPEQRAEGAFGVRVKRPGAELIYPEGTILVVMPITCASASLAHGRRVILQRINGKTVEVTARELRVIDGKAWLMARSSNPAYDTPVEMPWPGQIERTWKRGEDRFQVAGIVIMACMPEG